MRAPDTESPRLRHNNVTVLRLLLALIICIGHGAQLSGSPALEWIADALSSPYRIAAFFILSGLLIFRSYERSSSLRRYAVKRVQRIYPAYAFVVLTCAFALTAVTTVPLHDYFSGDWVRYVAANLAFLGFLQPTLPGVFEDNARPEVNGALWTLKIEVMFYAIVPVFVWMFARVGRLRVIAATYVASLAYVGILTWASSPASGLYAALSRQLPGQLAYLMAGALFYYYFPVVERHLRAIVTASVAALMLNAWIPLAAIEPLALAGVVVALALFTPPVRTAASGNLSYMLFIVHFPIAQVLAGFEWARQAPLTYLTIMVGVSMATALVLDRTVSIAFAHRQRRTADAELRPATASAVV